MNEDVEKQVKRMHPKRTERKVITKSQNKSEENNTKDVFIECIKETLKQWFSSSTYQYLNMGRPSTADSSNDPEIEGMYK